MAQSTPRVEPVANEPAATVEVDGERLLLIADYHAGIEAGLRYERGVELSSNAAVRRDRLCALLDRTHADRLVVLGDLGHRIGAPRGVEREELDAFHDAVVTDRDVAITLAPGNHDGEIESVFADRNEIDILPPVGGILGDATTGIGVLHGHARPTAAVVSAGTICMGHEHPQVSLTDSVGGSRTEKAWLRGRLDPAVLADGDTDGEQAVDEPAADPPAELVVFPAFNDRSGGTWINTGQGFLSPFLPDFLVAGECYLLDGTRLGTYQQV